MCNYENLNVYRLKALPRFQVDVYSVFTCETSRIVRTISYKSTQHNVVLPSFYLL